jgi:hypothetical protein
MRFTLVPGLALVELAVNDTIVGALEAPPPFPPPLPPEGEAPTPRQPLTQRVVMKSKEEKIATRVNLKIPRPMVRHPLTLIFRRAGAL